VNLIQGLDEHPWAGLAAPCIVFSGAVDVVDSAGDGMLRWGGAFKRGHGSAVGIVAAPTEVFGACGTALLIKREILDELQGFDEDFFISHEDVDLSYRSQLRGYRCVYIPGARVAHEGSATLGQISRAAVFYGQRNLEWMYFKNTPASLLLWTLGGHVVYNVCAAGYFLAIGRLRPFIAAKLAAAAGARRLWLKRRSIQNARTSSTRRIWELMEPRWLARKWREKAFDLRRRTSNGDAT
jgi:hypothetical protein